MRWHEPRRRVAERQAMGGRAPHRSPTRIRPPHTDPEPNSCGKTDTPSYGGRRHAGTTGSYEASRIQTSPQHHRTRRTEHAAAYAAPQRRKAQQQRAQHASVADRDDTPSGGAAAEPSYSHESDLSSPPHKLDERWQAPELHSTKSCRRPRSARRTRRRQPGQNPDTEMSPICLRESVSPTAMLGEHTIALKVPR